jgi:hypothetical protein
MMKNKLGSNLKPKNKKSRLKNVITKKLKTYTRVKEKN